MTRATTAALTCLTLALAGCGAGSPEGDTSAAATAAACAAAPPWTPGVTYATGSLASYQGVVYRCVQGHTALSVWPPDIVPALWQPAGCGGRGPPPVAARHGDAARPRRQRRRRWWRQSSAATDGRALRRLLPELVRLLEGQRRRHRARPPARLRQRREPGVHGAERLLRRRQHEPRRHRPRRPLRRPDAARRRQGAPRRAPGHARPRLRRWRDLPELVELQPASRSPPSSTTSASTASTSTTSRRTPAAAPTARR